MNRETVDLPVLRFALTQMVNSLGVIGCPSPKTAGFP
jgi:hypothetical protein